MHPLFQQDSLVHANMDILHAQCAQDFYLIWNKLFFALWSISFEYIYHIALPRHMKTASTWKGTCLQKHASKHLIFPLTFLIPLAQGRILSYHLPWHLTAVPARSEHLQLTHSSIILLRITFRIIGKSKEIVCNFFIYS